MATSSEKRQPYEPNRSCERCRSLKIRCLADESPSSSSCQRCIRLNLDCVYALPAKRRPRKRTDTKVAELEKEVRVLSSILRRQYDSSASSSPPVPPLPEAQQQQQPDHATTTDTGISQQAHSESSPMKPPADYSDEAPPDFIQSGLVSYEVAQDIFNLFTTKIIHTFPLIAFPAGTEMDDVRTTRPMLFFSIIAAGSLSVDPSLSRTLNEKLASILAMRSMVAGSSTSLDLLQALLVTTVWFYPGEKFDKLKYQQYTYMIAGVAAQIGFGKRPKIGARRTATGSRSSEQASNGSSPAASDLSEPEELELPRTLLSCYLLCAGISRSMHRPSIFPFTRRINDYLQLLATSPLAAPTDQLLVYWVQVQRIMCESATALGVDDPGADVDVSEPRTQHILQNYDHQLETWFSKFSQDSNDQILRFIFYTNRACLHEVALYSDFEPDDFKPPYAINTISPLDVLDVEWTAGHTQSISICWSNACKALDLFMEFPVDILRASPVVTFIRLMYTVVILLKLSASAESRINVSTSEMSFGHDYQRSRIIPYIDRIIPLLRTVCEGGRNPVAEKFSYVLMKIKNWSQWHGKDKTPGSSESLLEPLKDLSLGGNPRQIETAHLPSATAESHNGWTTPEADQAGGKEQFYSENNPAAWNAAENLPSFLAHDEGTSASSAQFDLGWETQNFMDFGAGSDFNAQFSPEFYQQSFNFSVDESSFSQRFFDWPDIDK